MMNILSNRKIRFFMAFFSLLLLFDMIQDSYAKYVSSAGATSDLTIAKWAFTVNNQDVLTNSDFSSTITPTFPGSTYIATGYIAPSSEGYFEIEIDSSNVDVTFRETIGLELADTNTVTDLEITGYSLNGGNVVSLSGNNPTIVTEHSLNEQNTVNTYTIYVRWKEGTGETMNNAADTQAAKNGVASVAITIDFLQTTSANASPSSANNP
jgi:hypothetical protein